MKNLIVLILAVTVTILSSCNQATTDVNALLQNDESKKEIFSAIIADHQMMTDFMGDMVNNEHAVMMMKGDQKMMGMMMKKGTMMKMMNDNPEMMHGMMAEMMKDGKMMGNMVGMMNKEGMMSEECMQSCKKMMDNKGMSMDMGNNDTEDNGKTDNESHH
jgi:outer membrane lipoprotein-sorting protein